MINRIPISELIPIEKGVFKINKNGVFYIVKMTTDGHYAVIDSKPKKEKAA